jgi:chemotaxis protein CheX
MEQIRQEEIVAAIRGAAAEVFETMLNLDIAAGEPYVEPNTAETTDGVVALIGLAGAWVGSGLLHCDPKMACRIYSSLLAAECGDLDINEEILDAVAEVANMIIGNAKNVIEEIVGPLGMSTPTVVFGKNFATRSTGADPWTVVPFASDSGMMLVKLCLAPAREPQPIRHGFVPPRLLSL